MPFKTVMPAILKHASCVGEGGVEPLQLEPFLKQVFSPMLELARRELVPGKVLVLIADLNCFLSINMIAYPFSYKC